MNKIFFIILAGFTLSMTLSCTESKTEKAINERADSFAVHYFNWQFKKCMPYVTPESQKFLQFAASNVMEGNVELLRSVEENATVEIDQTDIIDDETATVKLSVHNYIAADTIGRKAKLHDEGKAEIRMVKDGTNWYVEFPKGLIRTAYQQQNEQPSRDQGQDDK